MPISVATARDPFRGPAGPGRVSAAAGPSLRIPQARVLRALMPARPTDDVFDWPMLTRAVLGVCAGYTAVSGSITRALNGIHPNSSSGDPHPGLLARGLVEVIELDIDGVMEANYRVTAAGIVEYRRWCDAGGKLPPIRVAAICTNNRYRAKNTETTNENAHRA